MEQSKRKVIAVILISVIVISVTVSFAYFTSVLNNDKPETAILKTGTMALIFEDNDDGINRKLEFGESAKKYFTIENTGTLETVAKITFTNMINTYKEESLTYKLEYKTSETATEYMPVKTVSTNVPRSETASTQVLADGLVIPVKAKYYYRLTITLEHLPDVDQTDDIHARFSTTFGIEEGQKPQPLVDTLLAKANPLKMINESGEEVELEYEDGIKTEMYTFSHPETSQTDALTDYRYIGATPNNYITFNDETWRIIGVFTVDGEQRVKIMRAQSIGKLAWNKVVSNNWENASLKILLNEDYYIQTRDYKSTSTVKGLSSTARGQIEESTWYLGAFSWGANKTGEDAYAFERGSTVALASGSKLNIKANVGLIYPSDYIYTFANKVDDKCFTDSNNCNNGGTPRASWMYNGPMNKAESIYAIAPIGSDKAFRVGGSGSVGYSGNVTAAIDVSPVVYLKSDIKVIWGEGSLEKPYEIEDKTDGYDYYMDAKTNATTVEGSLADVIIKSSNDGQNGTKTTTSAYAFYHCRTSQTPNQLDYRYIGSNPNNYIKFNGETTPWQIIGVFPVYNSKTGEYENRVKIMRSSPLGLAYWNSSNINEWVNGYMHLILKKYYDGLITDGLTSTSRGQIDTATWYLGGIGEEGSVSWYHSERSGLTCVTSGFCSNQTRSITVEQEVGLIYPTDYSYIADYSSQVLNKSSWMHNDIISTISGTTDIWTISPYYKSSTRAISIKTSDSTMIYSSEANSTFGVIPTVYLKPSIGILRGNGSYSNPYVLSAN